MDKLEVYYYQELFKRWPELMPLPPNLFVYLKPQVLVCMQRMLDRNRDSENGVTVQYQSSLDIEHEKFFVDNKVDLYGTQVPVLKLETDENFKTDVLIQDKICSQIFTKLQSLQS